MHIQRFRHADIFKNSRIVFRTFQNVQIHHKTIRKFYDSNVFFLSIPKKVKRKFPNSNSAHSFIKRALFNSSKSRRNYNRLVIIIMYKLDIYICITNARYKNIMKDTVFCSSFSKLF